MLNNTHEKLSGFWLAESSAVFSWQSEKNKEKVSFKMLWMTMHRNNAVLSKHQMRNLFSRAQAVILFCLLSDWRRPNLLSALHEFWEDNIWSIQDTTAWNMTRLGQLLYFTSQTTKISRYVLLSKFCMLSAIVLLGWRCEKWTNLVLTGTENNRAISFIQKCPRGM